MGGFNVGDLYGSLHLDDADFAAKIRENREAARALANVELRQAGESARQFGEALKQAGIQTRQFQSYLNSLRAQGLSTKEALEVLKGSTAELQTKIRELFRVETDEAMAAIRAANAKIEKQREVEQAAAKAQIAQAENAVKYGKRIEDDARRRQQEMMQRMIGDAQAFERLEKEKADAAIREQHRIYFQYRELSAAASGLTTIGMAVGAMGAVPLAGMIYSAKQAAEFQDAMAKGTRGVKDLSSALRDELAAAARRSALETGISAKTIAENYYVIMSAGFSARDALDLTPVLSKFSKVTKSDLGETTRIILSSAKALQLSAEQIPDLVNKLVRADQLAPGTAAEFAKAIEGRAAGSIRIYGKTLSEAIALQMVMMKNGLSAAEAQTALLRVTQGVTRSVTQHGEVVTGIGKTWKEVIYNANGSMRTYQQWLVDIENITRRMTDKQKSDFFQMVGLGDRARTADVVKMLTGMSSELGTFRKEIENTGNSLGEMFSRTMDSPIEKLNLMKVRATDVAISLGTSVVAALLSLGVAIEPVAKKVEEIVGWFTQLDPKLQTFIATSGFVTFGAITMGGGLITAAGGVVRLYADLKLLTGVSGLPLVITMVESLAAKFGWVAVAALTAYEATKLFNDPKKWVVDKVAPTVGVINRFALGPMMGIAPWDKRWGAGDEKSAGQDAAKNYMEGVKAQVKQYAAELSNLFNGGGLTIPGMGASDPAKDKKDRQQLFAAVGLKDFTDQITEAKKSLAELNRMHLLTPGQQAEAQGYIVSLEAQLEQVGSTRTLLGRETEWSKGWALHVKEVMQAHEDLGNEVLKLKKNWADLPNKVGDFAAEASMLSQTGADDFMKSFATYTEKAGEAIDKIVGQKQQTGDTALDEYTRIVNFAKYHNVPFMDQRSLDDQAAYAKQVYDRLVSYRRNAGQGQNQEELSAWVNMVEAEAKAHHVLPDEINKDYRSIKEQLDNVVRESQSNWHKMTNFMSREMDQLVRDIGRGLGNAAANFLFGAGTSNDPLQPLITSFHDAYQQLTTYANPKQALLDVVNSIRNAGSAAQANAIAVRYFGNSAGPQLAKELRNGTISVSQINEAIGKATASTLDYANQTQKTTSWVTEMWRKLAADIVESITSYIIKEGLSKLLKWIFDIKDNSNDLGKLMVEVFKKIKDAIFGAGEAAKATADTIATATKTAANAAGPVAGAASGAAGAASKAAGSAGSGISGALSTAGAVGSVVSAVTGVVGMFQNMHQETTLNAIELNTRMTAIPLGQGEGGGIFGWLKSIYYQLSFVMTGQVYNIIDLLRQMSDAMVWGIYPEGSTAGAMGGGITMNFNAPITVQSNDPEQFVRQLKAQRVARGYKG